ncbi:hypothetical protein ACTFIU_005200 [Dictyostelium citrinum]
MNSIYYNKNNNDGHVYSGYETDEEDEMNSSSDDSSDESSDEDIQDNDDGYTDDGIYFNNQFKFCESGKHFKDIDQINRFSCVIQEVFPCHLGSISTTKWRTMHKSAEIYEEDDAPSYNEKFYNFK